MPKQPKRMKEKSSSNIKQKTTRMKSRKKNKVQKVGLIVIELMLFIVMIVSALQIYFWWIENQQTDKILNQIGKAVTVENNESNTEDIEGQNVQEGDGTEKYKVNFEELKEQNEDTVAWLKVPNTTVDFPVVRSTNNSYYLNHNYEKKYSSAGWIFLDYHNTDLRRK